MIVNRPQIIKSEISFAHRTEAAGSTLNSAYTTLRTGGYAAAGDFGAAWYVRTNTLPGHSGYFQSADASGYWELADKAAPEMLGAKSDGTTNTATAMQAFLDYNEDRQFQHHFPLSRKQRYYIDAKLTSVEPDLSIIGDVGPARQEAAQDGYITGPATGLECLLDWGNGTALATGALHLEKVRFWRTAVADYPAIRVTIDSNGPSRGITLRDVSCRHFSSLIELESPTTTEGWLVAANLTLENCNVNGCTYSVHALTRIFGVRIVGNQLEQGAKIHGLLDGPVTIADNMLEGQSDAIRIYDVSRCKFYLARNYFEVQTGDYAVSFEAENRDSEICVDENYGWFVAANTCTDLIRLIGASRLRFLPDGLVLANNRAQLFSLMSWTSTSADFNGQGFLAYANVGNRFLAPINAKYIARSTTGWTVDTTLGAVSITTPVGASTGAVSRTGFGSSIVIAETPTIGDLVVACALVRVDMHTSLATAWADTTSYTVNDVVSNGSKNWTALSTHTSGADFETDWIAGEWIEQTTAPNISLYNNGETLALVVSNSTWPADADGQWRLVVACMPASFTEAAQLRLKFGANGTSGSSNHTITIASIATKVVAAADFDGEGRVSVDHLIPPVA